METEAQRGKQFAQSHTARKQQNLYSNPEVWLPGSVLNILAFLLLCVFFVCLFHQDIYLLWVYFTPVSLALGKVPGEQWAITKSLLGQIMNVKSFWNSKKCAHKLRFYKISDLVSRVHIWRCVHLRKYFFYIIETEKALCLALCAVVANGDKPVRFLTTTLTTVRACDITAFLVARCSLRATMVHWCLAALCGHTILVANKVKRKWLSAEFPKCSRISNFQACPLQALRRRFKGFPAYGKHFYYRVQYLCPFLDGRTLISSWWQCAQPNIHFFSLPCCYRRPCDMFWSMQWLYNSFAFLVVGDKSSWNVPLPLIPVWAWMWWQELQQQSYNHEGMEKRIAAIAALTLYINRK